MRTKIWTKREAQARGESPQCGKTIQLDKEGRVTAPAACTVSTYAYAICNAVFGRISHGAFL